MGACKTTLPTLPSPAAAALVSPTIATTIAAGLPTARATGTATSRAAALTLSLLREAVGADVAEGCLHWIRLRLGRLAVGPLAAVILERAAAIASPCVAVVAATGARLTLAAHRIARSIAATPRPIGPSTATPLAIAIAIVAARGIGPRLMRVP